MNTWILMLFIALVCGLIHLTAVRLDEKYRKMELVSTTGTVTKFCQEDNMLHYYVRFYAGEKQIEKQVLGSYSLDTSYDVGDCVNIGYHINEKGYVTAFIQDEMLDEIKNKKTGNLFLILAAVFAAASVGLFVFSKLGVN